MTVRSSRRWYRLRWLTLLALSPLAQRYCAHNWFFTLLRRTTDLNGDPEFSYMGRGWPIPMSVAYSAFPTNGQVQNTSPSAMKMALIAVLCYDQQGRWPAVLDVTYSILLLLSTAFVCERRARGDLRISQFGLPSVFTATGVCAIVAAIWTNDIVIWNYGEPMHELVVLNCCGLAEFGWNVIFPMLFGIACTVFTTGCADLLDRRPNHPTVFASDRNYQTRSLIFLANGEPIMFLTRILPCDHAVGDFRGLCHVGGRQKSQTVRQR